MAELELRGEEVRALLQERDTLRAEAEGLRAEVARLAEGAQAQSAKPAKLDRQVSASVRPGDTRRYLEHHGLLRAVQAAMLATVRERPENPLEHLARLLLVAATGAGKVADGTVADAKAIDARTDVMSTDISPGPEALGTKSRAAEAVSFGVKTPAGAVAVVEVQPTLGTEAAMASSLGVAKADAALAPPAAACGIIATSADAESAQVAGAKASGTNATDMQAASGAATVPVLCAGVGATLSDKSRDTHAGTGGNSGLATSVEAGGGNANDAERDIGATMSLESRETVELPGRSNSKGYSSKGSLAASCDVLDEGDIEAAMKAVAMESIKQTVRSIESGE